MPYQCPEDCLNALDSWPSARRVGSDAGEQPRRPAAGLILDAPAHHVVLGWAAVFLEAAGAETVHGMSHLRAAGGVGTTTDNLDESANGENDEIEEMYPRFIREAEAEGRTDAVASFRLALDREKHHRAMFQSAFAGFQE